jgi:hypothetical protein
VPLVACDPYLSIWSRADRLTDAPTSHWTGRKQALTSLIRVDGRAWRLMGDEPKDVPAMAQRGVQVLPTRTIYQFAAEPVAVTLTFTTPALPDDLDVLSRPVTYLTWEVRPADGHGHEVAVYFSASAELAVNDPAQRVVWSRQAIGPLIALRIGSEEQPVLEKRGDDLRIDWGWAYVATEKEAAAATALAGHERCTRAFVEAGSLPSAADARMPRAVRDDLPVMAVVMKLGKSAGPASRHLILAYDDGYSIQYMHRNLRPYWRRNGAGAEDLLKAAASEYRSLAARCRKFDEELVADLAACGGERYAQLASLTYRQAQAGNKVVADAKGQALMFPKENFSNGCIGTVDVLYPMAPQFLVFSPTLAKASLVPVLNYAASPRWKFPFAPHDLGTYPQANGQVYGGGERTEENQMPVEESGNMILLVAAIAKIDGNADFAAPWWPQLCQWAKYLEEKGFDPENQLCTDDFAGHLAHNVNLSAKAILALGAFGQLCQLRGEGDAAARYRKLAAEMAARWVKEADDGDHFRLSFDRPGTWSQKYNLVWDRILGLDLFPPEVARKEMALYRKIQNRYGLPLDGRRKYAKVDWTVWTATLTGVKEDLEAIVSPLYDFVNETPQRTPLTDLYMTDTSAQVGMIARPVVGGVMLPVLADRGLWKKWSARDTSRPGPWAPMPKPPLVREIVPTARSQAAQWKYTFERPASGWFRPDFDAGAWKEGPAGFGSPGTPGAVVRTEWRTSDIWARREFNLPALLPGNLQFLLHHDEDAQVYLNGVPAARLSGYTTDYRAAAISPAAWAALKPGRNVLAMHCHQTEGGQYIDVGLAQVVPQD